MATREAITIASFAGSLRKASYNRALLRAAREQAPDGMTIEICEVGDVPLFNADVEAEGDPQAVRFLKDRMRRADGILIATPEYNYGPSGVTKNVVDWLSRPPKDTLLDGKAVAVMGASPGRTGTARAQSRLRDTLRYSNSILLPQPEILVTGAKNKFEDGRLKDGATLEVLRSFLATFYDWVLRVNHSRLT